MNVHLYLMKNNESSYLFDFMEKQQLARLLP